MMKVIIIDDEQNGRKLISNILEKYRTGVNVVASASSVEKGYIAILEHKPDLIFLDVRMRDGTGFDLLNRFKEIDFKIIFVTAHHEFAINAFKQSAVDYILKPISSPDIINALNKAEQLLMVKDWDARLKTLLGNIAEPMQQKQKIVLKTMERIYTVYLDEIIRLQSQGSYTEVYLKDRKRIMVSRQLKEFDELLSGAGFVRVHQSHLVNIRFIFCFEKADNCLTMRDGSVITVSLRKRENLLSILNSQ